MELNHGAPEVTPVHPQPSPLTTRFPMLARRYPFTWPQTLFVLSAALGAWLAYDQAAGWGKFLMVLGGVALAYVVALIPERIHLLGGRTVLPLDLLLLLLPAVIAGIFLLTHNWMREPRGAAWLGPLGDGLAVVASRSPKLSGLQLEANQAGGLIAAFLPLQIAALAAIHNRRLRILIGVPLLSLSALGLTLSAARGAWLVLTVVGLGCLMWHWATDRQARQKRVVPPQAMSTWWIVALLVAGGLVFAFLVVTPAGDSLQGTDSGRLDLWRNSLDLGGDYLFTGLGLASFKMAYSSYVLLVPVPFLTHAHNLFLDVWLEQGLLGLMALAWLVAVALRTGVVASAWQPAAWASIAVILLHGLVDDSFYGYSGVGLLLVFIPFGLLARPAVRQNRAPQSQAGRHPRFARKGLAVSFIPLAAVLIVAGVRLLPGLQAAWQANLGAVAQTRTELSIYRWLNYPIQDAVRRHEQAALAPAVALFQTALVRNPANVTANRRLGQIELSQGQYEEARRHLKAAYAADPEQRATRQLLGESYAISGEVDKAVTLWQTVDVRLGQLLIRKWWYEQIGDQSRAGWIAKAVRIMGGPVRARG
jgi:O-antigen ligase